MVFEVGSNFFNHANIFGEIVRTCQTNLKKFAKHVYRRKNLKKGIRHRLELLRAEEPKADDFFRIIKEEYRRADVGEDDIVDSMVLAYYAKQSVEKGIKTIPNEVEYDSQGLPKAIHFV